MVITYFRKFNERLKILFQIFKMSSFISYEQYKKCRFIYKYFSRRQIMTRAHYSFDINVCYCYSISGNYDAAKVLLYEKKQ